MATRFMGIVMAAGIALGVLAGCAAEDDVLFLANNLYRDPLQECELNATLFISPGVLDVADSYPDYPTATNPHMIANPRSYFAVFLMRTNGKEVPYNTPTGRGSSVYNYGGLPSNDILVEEVETRLDFAYNTVQPSADTLANIPAVRLQPANTWLGPKTKAGTQGAVEGTAMLPVELITTDIGAAMAADTEIFESLNYPNHYLLSVDVRARGRTTGGSRVQSEWMTYPLEFCRGCLVGFDACRSTCYPAWQDCM